MAEPLEGNVWKLLLGKIQSLIQTLVDGMLVLETLNPELN